MFWRPRRRIFATVTALALGVTAIGCARPDTTDRSSLRGNTVTLVDRDRLTACSSVNIEPFVFKRGNKTVGLNVDLGEMIGRELGVSTTIAEVSADEVDTGEALNTEQCDIVISPVTTNSTRQSLMDFSEPYYPANVGLAVRKDSDITGLADLKGLKMGAPVATSMDAFGGARAAGVHMVQFEEVGQELQAVAAGKVDAAVTSYPLILWYAAKTDRIKAVQEFTTNEYYAIAVRKGNKQVLQTTNKVLRGLKSSGDIVPLQKKWFGDTLPIPNW